MSTKKIGVLGSGIVGRVLASAFLKEGYNVQIGTRDITKKDITDWLAANPGGKAGSFAETATFGDIVVLATAGNITTEVIKLAGQDHFNNKVVIDATNPIKAAPPVNGVLSFFTDINHSLMEQLQALLPNAKLVKAFSCVGNAFFYQPSFEEGKPTMFIAGNDDEAKQTVTKILIQFGWDTADMGLAEAARAIEPLSMLWCIPGLRNNEWSHAFKLLKK